MVRINQDGQDNQSGLAGFGGFGLNDILIIL
jgi:hypothetical protein